VFFELISTHRALKGLTTTFMRQQLVRTTPAWAVIIENLRIKQPPV